MNDKFMKASVLMQRLKNRHYSDRLERFAYRTGYADGFHGRIKWIENHRYLNAYSAGYWDGANDANDAREQG